MSLRDTFKELHFYDYMIDDCKIAALRYINLKNRSKETYKSFDSIDRIEEYFNECDHVICVTAQTNANIMHLFFYIDDEYLFRSTHNDDTIINILRTYEKNLTKLCILEE
jgi:hypothetical protein